MKSDKANQDRNTLVIGGCRSGKSRHALELAQKLPAARKGFIATCDPQDDEMKARVRRHRAERDPVWHTIESPLTLPDAIIAKRSCFDVLLVDCLTVWLGNIIVRPSAASNLDPFFQDMETALQHPGCPLILVSNEVGTGIVPENPLARSFRDAAGFLNQRVAACCGQVVWMVAGIAVRIKP